MGFNQRMITAAVVVVVLVVLLAGSTDMVEAVTCNPTELRSCATAITTGSPPSPQCCNKLRQQRPCFCEYIQNPNLRQYVNSPNARKVLASCRVPFPKC